LNNVLKPQLIKRLYRLKVSILALPPLVCGCETWTLKQRNIKRTEGNRDEIHESLQ